jgi:DNA (cytosine-5)-methyltransferase 1
MKLLSLFTGIGAFETALKNCNISFELVNFCEINKPATLAYCAVHEEDINKNLWDVSKTDWNQIPKIDLLTHGSPCQSFSISGRGEGGDQGSGTKSSLMWNTVEAISILKPTWVIWENVKNLLSAKHRHNFENYLKTLEGYGYTNSYAVLNSKYFDSPQSRERIFVISNLEGKQVNLDFPKSLTKNFTSIEEQPTDQQALPIHVTDEMKIRKSEKTLFKLNMVGLFGDRGYEQSRRIYDANGLIPTLTTACDTKFIFEKNGEYFIRRITTKEAWRAMGFSDIQHDAAAKVCTKVRLYHQAGNSIVVPVLEAIFRRMFT